MVRMKVLPLIFCGVGVMGVAHGASLLSAQKFPKTFNDLTFEQRMDVLAAGFEPFETEYDDATGRCISNCPYVGITVTETIQRSDKNTADAVAEISAIRINESGDSGTTITPTIPTTTTEIATTEITTTESPFITDTQPVQTTTTVRSADIPIGLPLAGAPRISSPYGMRTHPVTKKQTMHWGIDFAVPTGTSVLAPGNGTVAAVWTDKSCGNAIRIKHANGYETTYCHLSQQLVTTGNTVVRGQEIAKSGNTGASTGPHLHYAIKRNGDGIDPTKIFESN